MPTLLSRTPFLAKPSEIVVRGERVRIHADQIIIWVSLSPPGKSGPQAGTPFPAIVDTGHNHTFAINWRHMAEWAGLYPESLETRSAVRDRGQRIELRRADLWIHPNENGKREELKQKRPHLLDAELGIAVYPDGDFPRLPILGLRAIAENGLVLKVNGARREATLRTPIRWWPFS